MTIKLSEQQEHAAETICLWHRNSNRPYFFLAGPAGAGKTSIINYVITESLNLTIPTISAYRHAEKMYRTQESVDGMPRQPPPSYQTAFAAFTAKAAQVMQSKQIPASTIHQLLYQPYVDAALIADLELQLTFIDRVESPESYSETLEQLREAKKPKFTYIPPISPRSRLRNTRLIVLDECSMIGLALWQDLMKTGIPVLILGDTDQLQPVNDSRAPFTQSPPDYQLTEIHRQAAENPIIDFATRARQQELIPFRRVLSPHHTKDRPQLATRIPMKQFMSENLNHTSLTWFDQMICATHRRRLFLNKLYRELTIGSNPSIFPQVGERIVCGANDHELQLFNGQTYTVTNIDKDSYDEAAPFAPLFPVAHNYKPVYIKFELASTDATGQIDLGTAVWVRAPATPFFGYHDDNFVPSNDFQFDYGYAITVHKAQGSQWSKLLIYNERMSSKQTQEDYAKWLYTALTRASECVVLAG